MAPPPSPGPTPNPLLGLGGGVGEGREPSSLALPHHSYAFSSRAAQTLYSGILETGSRAAMVSLLAAASA